MEFYVFTLKITEMYTFFKLVICKKPLNKEFESSVFEIRKLNIFEKHKYLIKIRK